MSPSKTMKNAQKSITVVLPVSKVSPNLLRAVYSVLGQVYLDFKLLVVYHPGTADSVAPVQELQNQRIAFYRSQHCHLAGLLKDGLSQTHTDWVAMIEPDNIWLGDKLEKEIELLAEADENTVALYSGYYVIDDKDQLLFRSPSISKSGDVLDTVIDTVDLIRPGALMASKEALSNVLNTLPSANLRVLSVALAHQGTVVSSGKRFMLTRNDERLTGANREADAIIEQEDAAVELLKPYLVRKQWRRYKNIQLRAYMYHYLLNGRLNDASVLFPKIHHSLFDNFCCIA